VAIGARTRRRLKCAFVCSVALLLGVHAALPWVAAGGVWHLAAALLVFFTAFNILEAFLPALATRFAPVGARGLAVGIFTSTQFGGAFIGAAAGGWVYGRWGVPGIAALNGILIVCWLALALGMKLPAASGQEHGDGMGDPQEANRLSPAPVDGRGT
jgi:predicted MFS family arabinose efflux permease